MTFETRPYTPDDYAEYKHWLDQRSRPVPDPENLPAIGCVVSADGNNHAIGFLFEANKIQCSIQNVASNPLSDQTTRGEAVEVLIDYLIELAKGKGFHMMCAASNKPKFIQRFLERKFEVLDSNLVQVGRRL